VLQNATGKQFFYFEINAKKRSLERMFFIRDHHNPALNNYSQNVIGFSRVDACRWFIINKDKHIAFPSYYNGLLTSGVNLSFDGQKRLTTTRTATLPAKFNSIEPF